MRGSRPESRQRVESWNLVSRERLLLAGSTFPPTLEFKLHPMPRPLSPLPTNSLPIPRFHSALARCHFFMTTTAVCVRELQECSKTRLPPKSHQQCLCSVLGPPRWARRRWRAGCCSESAQSECVFWAETGDFWSWRCLSLQPDRSGVQDDG